MSTHPGPGDRYNDVNKQAAEWQKNLGLAEYKVNQDNYLQLINGIIYGEDPRQGYVEGNTFYHPDLRFRFVFPSGWKLENSPIQVSIIPQDQKALMLFSLAQQKTLQSAADSTIAQYGLSLQTSKKTTVNGLPAIVTQSKQVVQDQSTGAQQSNLILTYFISYNNLIYVFHGITTEADFNNYSNTFNSAMTSFARLTDVSKINVKPKKVQVVKVQRNSSLSDAFAYYRVPQSQYKELALLNDLELTDQVQAGKLIKVVGE
jgi:predicted Zn-dependent protease